jgi:hypothetical protein
LTKPPIDLSKSYEDQLIYNFANYALLQFYSKIPCLSQSNKAKPNKTEPERACARDVAGARHIGLRRTPS